MRPELKAMGDAIVASVKAYIAQSLTPFAERIRALEERAPVPGPQGERGEKGEAGRDGKDGASGVQGERGEKGAAGRDGKDGAPGVQGERGEKGAAGRDGKDGAPGAHGERGEKGEAGRDGKDGAPGVQGERGEKGEAGRDGKSITLDDVRPVLEAELSKWELDFERRAQNAMQTAVDGIEVRDGRDGVDGLGFEHLDVEFDGQRTMTLAFIRNGQRKAFPLELPIVLDAGIYRTGAAYSRGDAVTYSGSLWIAQRTTSEKPDGSSRDWRLAVKRGRDGKDVRVEGEA